MNVILLLVVIVGFISAMLILEISKDDEYVDILDTDNLENHEELKALQMAIRVREYSYYCINSRTFPDTLNSYVEELSVYDYMIFLELINEYEEVRYG